jgi:hypothetical protein
VYAAFDTWVARVNAAYAEFDAAVATSSVLTARAAFRTKSGAARTAFDSRISSATDGFARTREVARTELQKNVAAAASDQDVVAAWDDYNAALQAALGVAARERAAGVPALRSAITIARGEYDDDLTEIENEESAESDSTTEPTDPATSAASTLGTKHKRGPRPR